MDPEIKRALANIRRRQAEINRRYGRDEDEGPLFDRSRRARQERAALNDAELDLEEWYDNQAEFDL